MHFVFSGVHERFKSFLSNSYQHGGQAFSLQYGTGQLLGIAGKDTVQVSKTTKSSQPLYRLGVYYFPDGQDVDIDLIWGLPYMLLLLC